MIHELLEWWSRMRGKPVFAPARARTGSPEWRAAAAHLAVAREILDEAWGTLDEATYKAGLTAEIEALWQLGYDDAAKRAQAHLEDVRGHWQRGT